MKLGVAAMCAGALLALGSAARPAQAFEREWHLGLAAGTSDGRALKLSPAAGIYGAYGISDVFDVRLETTFRNYRMRGDQYPNGVSAMLGLCYKLDVLSWIPWGGVYVGYEGFLSEPPAGFPFKRHDAALGLGVGLDYAFSRKLGFGVTLRSDSALTRVNAPTFDALLRAEYRWGW